MMELILEKQRRIRNDDSLMIEIRKEVDSYFEGEEFSKDAQAVVNEILSAEPDKEGYITVESRSSGSARWPCGCIWTRTGPDSTRPSVASRRSCRAIQCNQGIFVP